MKYYSTNNHKKVVSFETALINGIADDGGLYMPTEIPTLEKTFIKNIEKYSFQEIAFHIAEKFIGNDIEPKKLRDIIEDAINFPAPLVALTDSGISDAISDVLPKSVLKMKNLNTQAAASFQIPVSFANHVSSRKSINSQSKAFTPEPIPTAKSTSPDKELSNSNISSQKAATFSSFPTDLSVLELFHGPTLAFKDFGARFMARVMGHFIAGSEKELNILVATSGDTGSAVAYGFYGTPGINVYILYPKGKVSEIQEKQLTTLDKNITAIEIDGTFDDCQRLVKAAMTDIDLKGKNLSSANSINIARLIPQIFYYFEMYKQIKNKKKNIFVSVPSGNLGNLTAGLIAKKMGLPITKFISSLNSNSVFAEYISSGEFIPRSSVQTISNAMDVGNPSNLVRIAELYNNMDAIRKDIYSESFCDEKTNEAISEIYRKYNYIIDPHGAVGYLGLKSYVQKIQDIDSKKVSEREFEKDLNNNYTGIILETAHPAKFIETVENALATKVHSHSVNHKDQDGNSRPLLANKSDEEEIKIEIVIPERLAECLSKEKQMISLPADYPSFKHRLTT
ncbi:MAG: threonine synthase [Melioribacteraceae bacterium]|nr:threonine synthase [Melioribacteraceae bacterium]